MEINLGLLAFNTGMARKRWFRALVTAFWRARHSLTITVLYIAGNIQGAELGQRHGIERALTFEEEKRVCPALARSLLGAPHEGRCTQMTTSI